MRGRNVLATVTLVFTTVAATLYTISFSSNAWMKFEFEHKEDVDATTRFGLWEACSCIAIRNALKGNGDSEYGSGREYGSGNWISAEGSKTESSKKLPDWYTITEVMAIFSQVLLLGTLVSLPLSFCVVRKWTLIVRIILCICSAALILMTTAQFSDNFSKAELDDSSAFKEALVKADWGLGMAVIAFLLIVVAAGTSVIEYNIGMFVRNPRIELDDMQDSSVAHQPLEGTKLTMTSSALEKISTFVILGANVAMVMAISSPAWMQYVNFSQSLVSPTKSYGLWERCRCNPIYGLRIISSSDEDDSDNFPLWLTSCQWFASVSLVAMFAALVFAFISVWDAFASAQKLKVCFNLCLGLAGVLTIVVLSVYATEFPKANIVKIYKLGMDIKVEIDYGMALQFCSLFCTLVAFIFGLIQICLSYYG